MEDPKDPLTFMDRNYSRPEQPAREFSEQDLFFLIQHLDNNIRVLEGRTRKEPVQIRMLAAQRVAAVRALAARLAQLFAARTVTHQQLAEPQAEALLASSWWDLPPTVLWAFDFRDPAGFCERLAEARDRGDVAPFSPRTTTAADLLADLVG